MLKKRVSETRKLEHRRRNAAGKAAKAAKAAAKAAKAAGAQNIATKCCEDCALKVAKFGLPAEGRRRWCGGCATGHAGALDSYGHGPRKRCEDCLKDEVPIPIPW